MAGQKLSILLLEDSAADARLVRLALDEGEVDYTWERVETRDEFEAALDSDRFHIILADYWLPGFHGVAALEMARQKRPHTPFIFVSGAPGEELAIESLKNGATDYVLKSNLERLVPSVYRALRETRERQQRERAEEGLRFLASATTVLSGSLDYEATLSNLVHLAVPFLADCCVVDIFESEQAPRLVTVAHINHAEESALQDMAQRFPHETIAAPRESADEEEARLWGEVQIVHPVEDEWLSSIARNDEHLLQLQTLKLHAYLSTPLRAQGRAIGALWMATLQHGSQRSYDAHEAALADELAHRAALAVDNALLYRETQNAVRARDEFLATLSHELRTPLNAIMGWTQLLQGGELDEETSKQALDTIERNTKAQARLIADLLEVSRIITGKLPLYMAPVELHNVIEAAIEAVRPSAETKKIAIEYSHDPATGLVSGDASRLQQVMWNLLSNAIKFTPRGGYVRVYLDRTESFVRVRVSDNGQGISPEFLPHVFERFRQADSSSTRTHGGLGLGLGIVRHLVELHGGGVQAESAGLGQGATFSILLPLSAVRLEERINAREQILESGCSKSENPLADLRILVVDDQVDARNLLTTVLEHCGAQVQTAASVEEALRVLETQTPDIILSDIGMPDEDGYSFIQQVRAREHTRLVPAMALTAFARHEDRKRALLLGYQDYAVKPIEPSRLVQLVANLTGRVSQCEDDAN